MDPHETEEVNQPPASTTDSGVDNDLSNQFRQDAQGVHDPNQAAFPRVSVNEISPDPIHFTPGPRLPIQETAVASSSRNDISLNRRRPVPNVQAATTSTWRSAGVYVETLPEYGNAETIHVEYDCQRNECVSRDMGTKWKPGHPDFLWQMLENIKRCATCFRSERCILNIPCMCFCNCLECSYVMTRCALCQSAIQSTVICQMETIHL